MFQDYDRANPMTQDEAFSEWISTLQKTNNTKLQEQAKHLSVALNIQRSRIGPTGQKDSNALKVIKEQINLNQSNLVENYALAVHRNQRPQVNQHTQNHNQILFQQLYGGSSMGFNSLMQKSQFAYNQQQQKQSQDPQKNWLGQNLVESKIIYEDENESEDKQTQEQGIKLVESRIINVNPGQVYQPQQQQPQQIQQQAPYIQFIQQQPPPYQQQPMQFAQQQQNVIPMKFDYKTQKK